MKRSVLAATMLAAMAMSSCTGTTDALNPSALTTPQPSAPAGSGASETPQQAVIGGAQSPASDTLDAQAAALAPGSGAAASGAVPAGQAAAITALARVHVAPVVGAAAESMTPLSQQMVVRARERGVPLVGSGDASTTHVLRGYFSAFSEGRQTTVVYVWDVLDPAGNRLHRIQGQQRSSGAGEGWAAVGADSMQAIGAHTIDQLVAWLSSRTG